MRRLSLSLLTCAAIALAIVACDDGGDGDSGNTTPDAGATPMADASMMGESRGEIWVANRIGKSVSVIDVATNTVVDTLSLSSDGEPMYVNYSAGNNVVFVGDRANDRVVVFDADTRAEVATIDTGAGVFHQWALPNGGQLWVNNDVDKTTSVIDAATYEVLTTIPMPEDLAAMAGAGDGLPKPHDVLVSPSESAAYVTYLGFEGESDYVVRFDTSTFEETHRLAVGKDPHLSATTDNDVLYVPCQGSDTVYVLSRSDLNEVTRVDIPGAHGAGMAHNGDHLYVTNLPASGEMALYTIDTALNALAGPGGVDAPQVGVPHNIALNADDSLVYVTHSGGEANLVSVFEVSADAPVPSGVAHEITVGLNPFGLGFVP